VSRPPKEYPTCSENRIKSFLFSVALLPHRSIFMPGGAPKAHEVWFEELKQKVPSGKK